MNSFSFIDLFFIGFIAAYLYSFVLTVFALILPLLLEKYIISLFSSNMFNEILGLSISNSIAVLRVKLY